MPPKKAKGPPRDHFAGDGAAFAALIHDVVGACRGHVWCTYPSEERNLQHARLDIKSVYAHHDLLGALHAGQGNLSFPQSTVSAGVQLLVDDCAENFKLKPAERTDYIKVMTLRVLNLCRCVSQGQIKKPPAKWVQDLPWMAKPVANKRRWQKGILKRPSAAVSPGPSSSKAAKVSLGEHVYEYKFNKELLVCIRRNLAGGPAELSLPLTVASTNGVVVARWPDGNQREVPGLTNSKLATLLARGTDHSRCIVWTGIQVGTSHKVTIRQRPEKKLYLALYEQQRQVLQVAMDWFGPVNGVEKLADDDPTLLDAIAFMVPIAMDFCSNKIGRADLRATRNSALKAAGIAMKANSPVNSKLGGNISSTGATDKAVAKKPACKDGGEACPAMEKPAASARSSHQCKREDQEHARDSTGSIHAPGSAPVIWEPLLSPPREFFYDSYQS